MVYTLTLNPSVDYYVSLPKGLMPGQLNRSAADAVRFGGKGINVSRVLKAMGVESTTLGFLAGFTGQALEADVKAAGLDTRFLAVDGMTRINVKVGGGEETEINGSGPVITLEDMDRLYAQLDALGSGDLLVMSGSLPAGMPPDSYGRILRRLEGRGVDAVVDTAGEALRNALPYRPFLVKPNHLELGSFFGRKLIADAQVEECAREMQRLGARNVLVSMAGDGALLLDEGGVCRRISAPRGRVVSTIGAGDSMVAGFLTGWLRTGSYAEALKLGTAAGSATAFSLGLADAAGIRQTLEAMEKCASGLE